ncbi:MAG TPA: TraB/GumN family protein [Segetibacter sp.]
MRKFLSAFFSLLGVAVFFSCRSRNTLPTAKSGKSLLWEITGNGLKKPSYFFGTMHLMCAEDAGLSENVKWIIKTAGCVYLEVDMDNASELLAGILELRKNNGQFLSEVLSTEDYTKVKSFFDKYQPSMPFSVLEQQPPLMLTSGLYELLLPCDKKDGSELRIIEEAYQAKKETKGLETVAFQSSIFDSIPYAAQASELVKTIDSLEKQRRILEEMIAVYREQDVEKLYSLSVNGESAVSGFMELLLFSRNRNWAGKFPSIAKDNSTLFAVGAGHLGGDKGVLNLLKKEGYAIRPIEN